MQREKKTGKSKGPLISSARSPTLKGEMVDGASVQIFASKKRSPTLPLTVPQGDSRYKREREREREIEREIQRDTKRESERKRR